MKSDWSASSTGPSKHLEVKHMKKVKARPPELALYAL